MSGPRIIVAGQIPPPMGGQNAMILGLLEDLKRLPGVRSGHLKFEFTKNTRSARKGGLGKLLELTKVISRLVKLRLEGSIDLLVYPPGGPQTVPLLRDILLLPWVLLASKRVVLHFHAAGISDALAQGSILAKTAARLYGRCQDAVVMTEFNRRDPAACGIPDIHVIPHQVKDSFAQGDVAREEDGEIRILAMGHLCEDKGTRRLIAALGTLKDEFPDVILELAGEPLAPYTSEQLHEDISAAGIQGRVRELGVLQGKSKHLAFGRAHVFIFPSTAPYESFGLVMIEALMWGLPIVASDWRGNADVLMGATGTRIYKPAESVSALADSLRNLLPVRKEWPGLGADNRDLFLSNYKVVEPLDKPLPRLLLQLASSDQISCL